MERCGCNMFYREYVFGELYKTDSNIAISSDCLYSLENGFGFVTEQNRNEIEELKIAELNSAFEPWYWLVGEKLTSIEQRTNGCMIVKNESLPLIFKSNVPQAGNYEVTVTIDTADKELYDVMIFSQRRRLMVRIPYLSANTVFEQTFTVNVCDIIPRGKEIVFKDSSIDIAILASTPIVSKISIRELKCKTIYIAGDSTVTDQGAAYPYDPGCSYSGWAQMFPAFFMNGIAVSNHAHSGLTTESFVKEGHYDIVKKYIQPGDYFIMQFGHNDQKLPHLDAFGGYKERLCNYVIEMRGFGAIPIIVTPFARNTWKSDGSYNDLLKDFADACLEIGKEMNVAVIDLHQMSMDFVLKEGLERAKRYYFPKDYTHSNDYGAYQMARYVARACKQENITDLSCYIKKIEDEFLPPDSITLPIPPKDFKGELSESVFTSEVERADEYITRAEALDFIIKVVRFVPTNVYNDHYPDVLGHEWYAGVVEVSIQNNLLDDYLLKDNLFHPNDFVTWEELISYCIKGYCCRKVLTNVPDYEIPSDVSSYAIPYVKKAIHLSIIPHEIQAKKYITRGEAVIVLKQLELVL